jgi:hypothetical protein
MRRRIHACHMRRRIHAQSPPSRKQLRQSRLRPGTCHEKEDTCMSCEEEDTYTKWMEARYLYI